jgi:hypothetical protein
MDKKINIWRVLAIASLFTSISLTAFYFLFLNEDIQCIQNAIDTQVCPTDEVLEEETTEESEIDEVIISKILEMELGEEVSSFIPLSVSETLISIDRRKVAIYDAEKGSIEVLVDAGDAEFLFVSDFTLASTTDNIFFEFYVPLGGCETDDSAPDACDDWAANIEEARDSEIFGVWEYDTMFNRGLRHLVGVEE